MTYGPMDPMDLMLYFYGVFFSSLANVVICHWQLTHFRVKIKTRPKAPSVSHEDQAQGPSIPEEDQAQDPTSPR